MKKLLTIVSLAFLFFSCQKKESIHSANQMEETEATSHPESLESLAETMHGTWISDAYLNAIAKNKSIYSSRDYDSKILGFNLDKNELLKGNAVLEGFTDHEGGYSSPIVFDVNLNLFVNDLKNVPEYAVFTTNFQLKPQDGLLQMVFLNDKKTDVFRKLNADFETELRQIIAAGTYQIKDIKGEIVLNANGEVQNFYDYKYYELIFDFNDGFDFDAFVFFKSATGGNPADGTIFKYVRTDYELILQKVQTDWENVVHTFDTKKIVLLKK